MSIPLETKHVARVLDGLRGQLQILGRRTGNPLESPFRQAAYQVVAGALASTERAYHTMKSKKLEGKNLSDLNKERRQLAASILYLLGEQKIATSLTEESLRSLVDKQTLRELTTFREIALKVSPNPFEYQLFQEFVELVDALIARNEYCTRTETVKKLMFSL